MQAKLIDSEASLISALESCDRQHISDRPTSKLECFFASLRQRYICSCWRIVVAEPYRMVHRIRAILHTPNLKFGVAIPLAPKVDSDSFALNHNFALGCSEHIQQQQALYLWLGPIEAMLLGQAFRMGAEWQSRNPNSSACSEVRQS